MLSRQTIINVAVGILLKPNGDYLLASRPNGKGWAGWWEFPGGKLEQHETAEQALARELFEELGITPRTINPWVHKHYHYPATHDAKEKTVRLHFFLVTEWQGEPHAKEGQQLAWQAWRSPVASPVLPANAPIMHALSLPSVYAISAVEKMGESAFMLALQRQLDAGLSLLQVREKSLERTLLMRISEKILALCQAYGCRCLLNDDPNVAQQLGFDGVHLSALRLMNLSSKPKQLMTGASCHTISELEHAQTLSLDFVVFSPVLETTSHPEIDGMGWARFGEMIQGIEIPVYALGGMQREYLPLAWQHGARGVALLSGAWQTN